LLHMFFSSPFPVSKTKTLLRSFRPRIVPRTGVYLRLFWPHRNYRPRVMDENALSLEDLRTQS
jgi:hypothetical protein